MSTFYMYPIDQKGHHLHHQQQNDETGLSQLKPLSATGLSRILEIPLCLLDDVNSNDQQHQQQQQQVYWLTNAHLNNNTSSNNSTPNNTTTAKEDTSTISTTNELVTHGFANRKRSIVKRRKSVLSASFTAEDEAEAIRIDREQTLAALERGHWSEEEGKEEKTEEKAMEEEEGILEHDSLDRESEAPNSIYSQNNLTLDVDHVDLHDVEYLEKSQEMNRGKSKKEHKKEEEYEEGEEEEEENNIPFKQVKVQQQQTEGANVVNPKDSAIDLRATASEQEKEDKEQAHIDVVDNDENNNSSCAKVIDLSLTSSSSSTSAPLDLSSSPSMATTTTATTTTTTITTVKKKSSWLPRKMFSTSSKKSTIDDKQEKFNISSLFSRKSSSPPSKKSNSNNKKLLECTTNAKNDRFPSTKKTVLFNYTRLPIHTERAIYRLSHLKLTNPRRPLRDQVIISNLMFWYLSTISTNNNKENEPASMDHLVMTKKACRMQQQQIHNKKRRMRNQIRPENSNAMDFISKQPKKPHQHHANLNKKLATRPYPTNNSSSEEEDDDEKDTDTDSDDNSDNFSFTSSTSSTSTSDEVDLNDENKKTKKTKKYLIFNNKKKDKKWLPSFSKGNNNRQPQPQQNQLQQEDEDDIPLAMYQKK